MSAPNDRDVRDMLERRAADVHPSPDAWERIAARLDGERPGRPAAFPLLAAAAVAAVLAVASVLVTERQTDRRVSTRPAERPSPTLAGEAVVAVWPAATAKGLDEVQDRVDAGEQRELLDPRGAATVYLNQRLGFASGDRTGPGLSVGGFRPGDATSGEVPYASAGVRGTVVLRRVGGEGRIWSVVASTSERLAVHMFGYDGQRVSGEVVPAATGRLTVHLTGTRATVATAGPSGPVPAGQPVAVNSELRGEAGVVVLLRLIEEDGGAGVTEFVVDAAPPAGRP